MFLAYNCSDWETDGICYPKSPGNKDGTRQSNRTCQSLIETYNDTIQILAENCTFDAGLSVFLSVIIKICGWLVLEIIWTVNRLEATAVDFAKVDLTLANSYFNLILH